MLGHLHLYIWVSLWAIFTSGVMRSLGHRY